MDLTIPVLGQPKVRSPLKLSSESGDRVPDYVHDDDRLLFDVSAKNLREALCKNPDVLPLSFERAGPRELLYFDPSKTRVGVVTCGGLCPGINNVIRALVMELHYHYGVRRIYGFRFGFAGLSPEAGYDVIDLTPEVVNDIHHDGGSILGSSRGPVSAEVMVDTLDRLGMNILFVIGGDGTLRGALDMYQEISKRGMRISIIGIPKTIDNDICLVEKTFGFETAFSIAIEAIRAAHVEAKGSPNGIGMVRLMGRNSGYIAATAALAEPNVDCVLVPEIPFKLEGERGFYTWLQGMLKERGYAVIVVAEGAGQELMAKAEKEQCDASGNVRLADIGLFLKDSIAAELKRKGIVYNLKYIDPSYLIRSAPANPNDSLFCLSLGQNAAHAGMSGKTGMVVGIWNNGLTHVPIREAVAQRKVVDPESDLWRSVMDSTRQPARWE